MTAPAEHSVLYTSRGRIDLHCHLLPGVDDGCQTMQQSLQSIRQWIAAGYVGSVCTPHVGAGYYQNNTPDNIAHWLKELRAELRVQGIDYALWDGGEVRMNADTIEWFSTWGLPTLGPGRCVLLDYWGKDWPEHCEECFQFLLENGYQPIYAHPERMSLGDTDWNPLMDRLVDQGVWLQGNLNSISGGEGKRAKKRAWRLLSEEKYYVVASDFHQPQAFSGRLEGIQKLEEKLSAKKSQELLVQRPREILLHKAAQP